MPLHLAPIVEGHGEQLCVVDLLKRIRRDRLTTAVELRIADPLRKKRDQITKKAPLGGFVNEAVKALRQQARGDPNACFLVLILIDSEGACPGPLAAQLVDWAKEARSDVDIACVLAHPMWETWFVASASSLAGFNGMPPDLAVPPDPERRGKSWIIQQLRSVQNNRGYSETVDQPFFSQKMDLAMCHQNSRSFRKLCRELAARMPPGPAGMEAPLADNLEGPPATTSHTESAGGH